MANCRGGAPNSHGWYDGGPHSRCASLFSWRKHGAGLAYVWLQGTPSALKNPSDETWLTDETSSRRKSTPGDASMRRSIQDLALSIDPNVKIEPEVEDVRSPPAFPLITFFLMHHFCYFRVSDSCCWTSPTSSSTRSPISAAVSRSTAAAIR